MPGIAIGQISGFGVDNHIGNRKKIIKALEWKLVIKGRQDFGRSLDVNAGC